MISLIKCTRFRFTLLIIILMIQVKGTCALGQVVVADTSDFWPLPEGASTNLILASSRGYDKICEYLIINGADVNTSTYDKLTPLMLAVSGNHLPTAQLLLKYGANTDLLNLYDETALLIAVKSGFLEMAELLIRNGSDPNQSDKKTVKPIHYSSVYGDFYMTDMLIYYSADINAATREGTTPLMAAVWAGAADVADLLLLNGADPNASDKGATTAFHIASQNGDTLILKLLIKYGADINAKDKNNYNAIGIAARENHPSTIKWLLKSGIDTQGKGAVSPVAAATKYRSKESLDLLRDLKIGGSIPIGIDQFSISSSIRFTSHDIFTGLNVEFKEPYLNAGFQAGLDLKPASSRLLVLTDDENFVQYRDSRSMVNGGLFKDFGLRTSSSRANIFLRVSLMASYTFGNAFPGTSVMPGHKTQFVPSAGIRIEHKWYHLMGDLSYQESGFYRSGPVWLRLGCGIDLFFDNVRAPAKMISWY